MNVSRQCKTHLYASPPSLVYGFSIRLGSLRLIDIPHMLRCDSEHALLTMLFISSILYQHVSVSPNMIQNLVSALNPANAGTYTFPLKPLWMAECMYFKLIT